VTDLSKLSDAELQALYAGPKGVEAMSDDELKAAYGQQPQRSVLDKLTGRDGGERYQTWPEKAVRGLASSVKSAATLPGDVMSGAASPDDTGRVLDMAAMGTPMAPRAAASIATKAAVPSAQELKVAGSEGYNAARDLGVEIAPASLKSLGEKIGLGLGEKGIDATLAPKTHGIIGKLANPPPEAVVTVSNLETLRRSLGHAAKDFTNPTEQLAAKRALADLSDYMATIPSQDVIRGPAAEASQLLKNATGNYAASKRSQQLTEAVESADLNAAAANSGQNIGNATRQRIKSILASDKKSAGYSPEELAQMEAVVRGTRTGNTARIVGNLLGGGGGLGSVVSAAAGAAVAPPLAALPIVGYGMKKLSDASVQRQIRLLDEMVRKRSPLGESMPAAGGGDEKRAALIRALMLQDQQ